MLGDHNLLALGNGNEGDSERPASDLGNSTVAA
jgi:hypothetical protein